MFIGHYSTAFIAKRVAPTLPLPIYFLACQIIDFFWAFLVLLDIEKLRFVPHITATNSFDFYFMPYSHGLVAACLWSSCATVIFWLCTKSSAQRARNALVIGAVVGGHWLLDFVVHRPDLPLLFDGIKVGLSVWDFKIFAMLLELALLWGGVAFVLKATGGNRTRYLLLAVVMSIVQVLSILLPEQKTNTALTLQILATYTAMIFFSHWADKQHAATIPS